MEKEENTKVRTTIRIQYWHTAGLPLPLRIIPKLKPEPCACQDRPTTAQRHLQMVPPIIPSLCGDRSSITRRMCTENILRGHSLSMKNTTTKDSKDLKFWAACVWFLSSCLIACRDWVTLGCCSASLWAVKQTQSGVNCGQGVLLCVCWNKRTRWWGRTLHHRMTSSLTDSLLQFTGNVLFFSHFVNWEPSPHGDKNTKTVMQETTQPAVLLKSSYGMFHNTSNHSKCQPDKCAW